MRTRHLPRINPANAEQAAAAYRLLAADRRFRTDPNNRTAANLRICGQALRVALGCQEVAP